MNRKLKKISLFKFIITTIPLMILLQVIFHSVNNSIDLPYFLLPFFPISESIFEHMKLCIFPTLIIWGLCYLLYKDTFKNNPNKWLISVTVSILTNIFITLSTYYIGAAGFNLKSTVFHINTIIIGTILGQLLAIHFYSKGNATNRKSIFYYAILLILIFIMIYFTFIPGNYPIFY